ncbi:hypothetical protein BZA05DRAFT_80303 [Tricharina praecox]|uniref:uncharacterized protein n=1 Tax=Tricharina praecox TaxID=43433 RepID=UPI002220FC15|nr:uncharacterized protein BZA05DRAFT_80303 [Tricharina praecox]KAI5849000.1 hypothetical protein BZA05DRAFT_80303 [Tricharina praecox]
MRTMRATGTTVLSFFCNRLDDCRKSGKHILLSMIGQLLFHEPQLYCHIHELKQSLSRRVSLWSEEDVWSLFGAIVSRPTHRKLVCLVDALGECGDRISRWLMGQFVSLQEETDFPLRLIVSGDAKFSDIVLEKLQENMVVIDLDSRGDGRTKVLESVTAAWISDLVRKSDAYTGLEDFLLGHYRLRWTDTTTFLAIRLSLELLVPPITGATMHSLGEEVRSLDMDLPLIYARLLENVSLNDRSWALKVLHWTCHTFRPLTINEFSVALSIHIDNNPTHSLLADGSIPLDIISDIARVFGPLIITVRDELHLVHPSFKDFLVRKRKGNEGCDAWYSFENADYLHSYIFDICLEYLSADPTSQVALQGEQLLEDYVQLLSLAPLLVDQKKHSLLLYAFQYWPKHYRRSADLQRAPSSYSKVLDFLSTEKIARPWYNVYGILSGDTTVPYSYNPVSVAARLGLPKIVEELSDRTGSKLSASERQEPLDVAAMYGHHTIVRELLCSDIRLSKALKSASGMGHPLVVKELLDAAKGHGLEVAQLSVERAFFAAVANGHAEVVKLLLQSQDGTLASKTHDDWTPLQHAAQNGRDHVVSVLLDHRQRSKTSTGEGDKEILAAKRGRGEGLEDSGWGSGAEVSDLDATDKSPLHLAANEMATNALRFTLLPRKDMLRSSSIFSVLRKGSSIFSVLKKVMQP